MTIFKQERCTRDERITYDNTAIFLPTSCTCAREWPNTWVWQFFENRKSVYYGVDVIGAVRQELHVFAPQSKLDHHILRPGKVNSQFIIPQGHSARRGTPVSTSIAALAHPNHVCAAHLPVLILLYVSGGKDCLPAIVLFHMDRFLSTSLTHGCSGWIASC